MTTKIDEIDDYFFYNDTEIIIVFLQLRNNDKIF